MKFEIHFEFRASLRKFQDLNFWDATFPRGANFQAWLKNPLAVPHPLSGYDVLCATLRLDRCRVDS
jgi:hypothetical protein